MNGLYDLLAGAGNSIINGVSDFGSGIMDLFGGSQPAAGGMSMVDGTVQNSPMESAVKLMQSGETGANPGLFDKILAEQPKMTPIMPGDLDAPSLLDSLGNSAKNWAKGGTVLEDLSAVGNFGGGLYDAMLKGKLVDEQLKTAQQNRRFSADEKNRQRDFIGTTANTFGGGNSSNYYSA